ncbi:MAG: hypothetical protein JXR97_15385 [Planctomycetes bacterium]|nr:hypothetical protein [Planctomycetota bacterium]
MIRNICVLGLMLAIAAGCEPGTQGEYGKKAAAAKKSEPSTGIYYEGEHKGRFFVIGTEGGFKKLKEHGHIPYARTLIGEGPEGKTLVIEIDNKNPALTDSLYAQYLKKHPYYAEQEMHGRYFVIGNPATMDKLIANGHIPYAKTLIGEGPEGKTLVIEIDNKHPEVTERLYSQYLKNHPYYAEQEAEGRLFVIGKPETMDKLMANGHIPYAKTHIGAGPGGKTVVIEIDNKDASLAERLEKTFCSNHKMAF